MTGLNFGTVLFWISRDLIDNNRNRLDAKCLGLEALAKMQKLIYMYVECVRRISASCYHNMKGRIGQAECCFLARSRPPESVVHTEQKKPLLLCAQDPFGYETQAGKEEVRTSVSGPSMAKTQRRWSREKENSFSVTWYEPCILQIECRIVLVMSV